MLLVLTRRCSGSATASRTRATTRRDPRPAPPTTSSAAASGRDRRGRCWSSPRSRPSLDALAGRMRGRGRRLLRHTDPHRARTDRRRCSRSCRRALRRTTRLPTSWTAPRPRAPGGRGRRPDRRVRRPERLRGRADPRLHRGRRPAVLRAAPARVPGAADRAQGRCDEPALGRRGLRRRRAGGGGRRVRQPARRRHRHAGPALHPGDDVRDPVRTLDGLRGVPDLPDPRGVPPRRGDARRRSPKVSRRPRA